MPTTRGAPTRTRTTRTRTTPRSSRTGTQAATPRRYGIAGGWVQRRQPPKKSGPQRALQAVTGALPGMASSSGNSKRRSRSKSRRGGKASGIALATAAAGVAFKNRGKLMEMFSRRGEDSGAETSPVAAGTRPATGADPISGDIAPTDPSTHSNIPPPAAL